MIDNKAEKYPWTSPYTYALNNPIVFIDPDGNDVNVSYLTDKAHIGALQNMLSTKAGYAFIARYMGEGTLTVGNKSYSFKSSGDRAKDVLYIQSTSSDVMEDRNGTTRTFVKGFGKELNQVTTKDNIIQGVSEVIDLKGGLSEKKATNTLGHEAFVHADKDADRLNSIDKKMTNGDYNRNTSEYINDAIDVSTSGQQDHKDLGNGKVPKYENYSKELSNQKQDPYYYNEYKKDADRFK